LEKKLKIVTAQKKSATNVLKIIFIATKIQIQRNCAILAPQEAGGLS
jgi:hypothetical protein